MRRTPPRFTVIASALLASASFGCVDPEGEYDKFLERADKTVPPPVDAGEGGLPLICEDPTAACDQVTVGALDGQWLFALAATLGPTKPILFFADITTSDSGGQVQWQWTIAPLDAKTRTPVPPPAGDPLTLDPSVIPADGNWIVDLPPLDVPGAANPITGSDITAEAELQGQICGGRDFFCGDALGTVTKPLTLNLCEDQSDPKKCSHWTLQRLPAPDTLPDNIFVDCSCRAADAI